MGSPTTSDIGGSAQRPVRVVIAESDPLVREGLRSALAGSCAIVVAEAASGQEVEASIRACRPDVLLIDVEILEAGGLDGLAVLKKVAPGLALVALSAYEDPAYLVQAVAHGAIGCLSKGLAGRDLLAAIEAAAEGRSMMDRGTLVRAVEALACPARSKSSAPARPALPLSPRERQVLVLLSQGLSNRKIAALLGVSVGTVKTHVCNILTKLAVADRVQAAVWAIEHGLGGRHDGGQKPAPPAEPLP